MAGVNVKGVFAIIAGAMVVAGVYFLEWVNNSSMTGWELYDLYSKFASLGLDLGWEMYIPLMVLALGAMSILLGFVMIFSKASGVRFLMALFGLAIIGLTVWFMFEGNFEDISVNPDWGIGLYVDVFAGFSLISSAFAPTNK